MHPLVALALALTGCGRAPADPQPEPAPRPEGVPVAIRVLSAGVEGEYPVPLDDETPPNLSLHLVDGSVDTAWTPTGTVRLEVRAATLRNIELLHTGVQRLRWRPLHAEGEALRAGPWTEVDLAQVPSVGGGPWQRIPASVDRPIRGIELDPMAPSPAGSAAIAEIRLVGIPAGPDDGVRSTTWTVVASSTPDGPFQPAAGQPEAVDPARCAVWIDGVEHRGTKTTCGIDGEWASIGVPDPEGGEPTVHRFHIREIGGCFALVDGWPYTRCAPRR